MFLASIVAGGGCFRVGDFLLAFFLRLPSLIIISALGHVSMGLKNRFPQK